MKEFFKKHKKSIGFFLILILIAGPFAVEAQVASPGFFKRILIDIIFIPFTLTSWILWLGGQVLNFVMDYTVTNMQANIQGITSIDIAWGTIRDVMNLTFIFVLLYTAIGTILDVSGVNWKKSLISIILAAILINFSLFFTKVIIDASNIATLTFYRQIVPIGSVRTGLSNSIMEPLGLTTIYNPDGAGGASTLLKNISNLGTASVVSLGGSVFFLATAFVFSAVSIMFLIRYVTFIFLLILSPVAFMGSIIPKLGQWVDKWWKSLWDQVLFAPIFMILVWIVVVIINSPGFICSTPGSIADTFKGVSGGKTVGTPSTLGCITGSSIGLIINYVVVTSFIIGALTIAKEVASQGGSVGAKIVGGALGLGGAVVGGVGGYAGRKFIGSRASEVANDKDLQARAAGGDIRARLKLAAAQKIASSSFDVRAATSGIGKGGGEGGYEAVLKRQVEAKKKIGESLAPSKVDLSEADAKIKQAKDVHDEKEKLIKEREEKAQKAHNEMVKRAETEARTLVKEPDTLQQAKRNAVPLENMAKDPNVVMDATRRQKLEQARAEVSRQTELHEANIKTKTQEITIDKGGAEIQELAQAKKEREDFGKSSEKEALDKARKEKDVIVTAGKERKEKYIETLMAPGKVTRASRQAAAELRTGKSEKEKFVEAAKALAKKEGEEAKETEEPKPEEEKKPETPASGAPPTT